jgi:K+-transporting ATPase ATPase C chain
MLSDLRTSVVILLLFSLITGVAYPLAITAVAQLVFPHHANGSLIEGDGRVVGSELVGQTFSRPEYFWGRPSATSPVPNNAASSSGSNLGPTNPALIEAVQARVLQYQQADPGNREAIPIELVTSSASGLDPHISPAGAGYQVSRVARARGMSETELRSIVEGHTEGRTLGLLGEPRVNVLELNLALDRQAP